MEFTVGDLGHLTKRWPTFHIRFSKSFPDQLQSIIWELVRKADSQSISQTHQITDSGVLSTHQNILCVQRNHLQGQSKPRLLK